MVDPLIRPLIRGVCIPLPGITPLLRIALSSSKSMFPRRTLPLVRVIQTRIWVSTAGIIRRLIRIRSTGITLIGLFLIVVLIVTRCCGLLRIPLRALALRCPLGRVPLVTVLVRGGGGAQGLGEMDATEGQKGSGGLARAYLELVGEEEVAHRRDSRESWGYE